MKMKVMLKTLGTMTAAISLALVLGACSKDEGSKSSNSPAPETPVVKKEFPKIQAPNNATVEDYTCKTDRSFIEQNGNVNSDSYNEIGFSESWESENQMINSFIETSDNGNYKLFGTVTRTDNSATVYTITNQQEAWINTNGQWTLDYEKTIITIKELQADGSSKTIKRTVNGVEKVNYIKLDYTDLGNKSDKLVFTHTKPSEIESNSGRKFTSWVMTCIYTGR
jgi:PBP1b-binding outer membrane lipoprotein LpoB